jgi:tRNA (guanine37-N1)-methyltransferase
VLAAQGRAFDQAMARELAAAPGLLLVCGRYEGIDERFTEAEVPAELSLGDYVVSGGELAASIVIDAVARLLPGVLGDETSHVEDSFTAGLLDCPQYTRPDEADGRQVPQVLLGGDHEAIRRWRLKQALGRTWVRRPQLLAKRQLTDEERELLAEFTSEWRELNSRS